MDLNSSIDKTRHKCQFWQALVLAKKYSLQEAKKRIYPKRGHFTKWEAYTCYYLLSGLEGNFCREFMSYYNKFDYEQCKNQLRIYADEVRRLKKLNHKGGKKNG